ncbi:DNA/RNA helicase domain-containing protein [Imperialibacter roseus]|uniref:DNA/RNA helicase domain-containing protein n=1 Tax=Imperialibacter roseus TaxID=1324217 RepID=A0ABZ0IR63_9BACT|nr:DNA/RNA helicase domain-containing protein [Imperialibacter roseus]WOK06894.1 DNA/RNA helicase domain-containing protein [Imperialibacter roseus]
MLSETYKNTIVQGGAGTGKTILALFLSKILKSPDNSFNFREFQEVEEFTDPLSELRVKFPDPKIGLVVPMASFRNTLKKVFKNVKGLNSSMVIGPAEVVKQKYDILIVDEAHRLRRRVNLGTYFGSFDSACEKLGLDKASCSELDWVLLQSRKCILFYDEAQSIKPSDVKTEDFQKLKNSPDTTFLGLKSQLRVNGGNDYVEFVSDLLDCRLATINQFQNNEEFEVLLFESIDDLVSEIKAKESQYGLSRLVAGYSWEWVSKGDDTRTMTDIEIEGTKLRWNSVASDWITSEGAIDEVGCIHTTQGYDLNYIGVIFGNEITYNPIKKEIEVIKENYFDRNGKMSINNIEQLKAYIINIYKTIMLRGIRGAYIFICDAELRKYMAQYIPEALHHKKSPLRILTQDEAKPFENCIPIYNLRAAAGNFSESQIVDELDWLELPSDLRPKTDMFACQVVGRSMNVVIPDGAICLFRRYQGGSRNGKIVLVESTSLQDADTGSNYTVKEYHSGKTIDGDGWQHNSITLKPLSDDPNYSDIVLTADAAQQLRVIGVFDRVLDS